MNEIVKFGMNLYSYCTDFVINLANILDLSYYEINFIVFCILYPLLLISSFGFYIMQKVRLNKYSYTKIRVKSSEFEDT